MKEVRQQAYSSLVFFLQFSSVMELHLQFYNLKEQIL